MTLKLIGDVPNRLTQILLPESGGIEPATPLEGAGNATVCSHRRDTLGEAHEITQPGFRPKTDHQMDMVCEYRIAQHSDGRTFTRALECAPDVVDCCVVYS